MRISRVAARTTAAVLITLAIPTAGCTNQIAGTPQQDPTQPPVALSDDGAGIVAGYPDAPVQIELFTEPQCSHCAELQAEYGKEIGQYINLGELAVTYRPLTFLDQVNTKGYSARVANALFLTVGPPDATEHPDAASAPEFQRFVEELWAHQEPGGPGPSDEEMAKLAKDAGIPADVAAKIGDGQVAKDVDIEQMATFNFGTLVGIDPVNSGTPTVYDLGTEKKVNLYNSDWLDKLMSSA